MARRTAELHTALAGTSTHASLELSNLLGDLLRLLGRHGLVDDAQEFGLIGVD